VVQPVSEFYGRRNQCRACVRKRTNAWKAANLDLTRAHKWKNRYGISEMEYDKLFERQYGLCAICECEPEILCVDHDHETGQVRGQSCNRAIGALKDDPALLLAAYKYLKRKVRHVST
jgi:hypothetical protein